MKIIYETTITQIGVNTRIKPIAPLWAILNDGIADMYINGSYTVHPGERFGIDATQMLATSLLKGIMIENATQFDISFEFVSPLLGIPQKRVSAQFFETIFKIQK